LPSPLLPCLFLASFEKDAALFRLTGGKGRPLGENRMSRVDAWEMIKRRALRAGTLEDIRYWGSIGQKTRLSN